MNCDDITVLYAQVMPDDPVDAGASNIEIIIGKHNQNSLLALFASDCDCVASEEPKGVHGVV